LYLRDIKETPMPNPVQARNLAAACRGIRGTVIINGLVQLDWDLHIALIGMVRETPARLFYLRIRMTRRAGIKTLSDLKVRP